MTIPELRAELEEVIQRAQIELRETAKAAPNSYGHGHEYGYWAALKHTLHLLNEDESVWEV
jgi:hypothetical protein